MHTQYSQVGLTLLPSAVDRDAYGCPCRRNDDASSLGVVHAEAAVPRVE